MRIIYFLAALLFLQGCGYGSSTKANEEKPKTEQASQVRMQLKEKPADSLPPANKANVKENEEKNALKTAGIPPARLIDVVLINQNPELRYGCEVTSLAMVLRHAGVKVGKMDLYRAVNKDSDPLIRNGRDIIQWGNPADGFVGDMTGKRAGYAVFDKPITALVELYLPGRSVNLTNKPFEEVLAHVGQGYPVVVWTTGDYRLPDRWEAWSHKGVRIKTPLDLHAVVLVGYDSQHVYLNDPLSGKKQVKVQKKQFITSWKALNCRAVSYK